MTTVADLLIEKQARLHSIPSGLCVLEATQIMNEHAIGALVVVEGTQLAGIFTERDVLRRVVAAGRSPVSTRVATVMTSEVIAAPVEMSLEEARCVMKHRRIRHLPVVRTDGTVIGMVSIGDLNAHQCASQEVEIFQLHEYLYGRV